LHCGSDAVSSIDLFMSYFAKFSQILGEETVRQTLSLEIPEYFCYFLRLPFTSCVTTGTHG